MVIIQPSVWISIWLTLIDCVQVEEISVTACSRREYTCSNFKLNCTLQHIRIIGAEYRYKKKDKCESDSCSDIKECCFADNNDCTENYTDNHLNDLLRDCDGKNWCGPIPSPPTPTLDHISGSNEYKYPGFIHLTYTCIPPGTDTTVQLMSTTNGPSSSGNKSSSSGPSPTTPRPETTASNIMTSTSTLSTRVSSSDNQTNPGLISTSLNDGEEHPERLIIIVVVVVAVLVLSAILVIVFILHRRRCKKSSQADAPKNQLPDVLINHSNLNFGGTDQDFKAAESSNYDEMNDESIATYSRPVKKKKDGSTIAIDEKKTGGNCATDEYDRIEFAKKYPVKMTNYDSVSATEVKKVDDTYSHVSKQWKPASAAATNDYSHCQFIRHESKSNDDTNKTAVSNEPLIADTYSHVDLNAEKTKIRPSNIIEEDSYNPNELDKTTNPPRNGHAVSVRTIAKSEEGSQTFKDLQSLGAESEGWPICDRNSGVSSQDQPLQDIKAICLPDKYIEFKIGDIYDTPRCKDQQYNVVLKGNKEHNYLIGLKLEASENLKLKITMVSLKTVQLGLITSWQNQLTFRYGICTQ